MAFASRELLNGGRRLKGGVILMLVLPNVECRTVEKDLEDAIYGLFADLQRCFEFPSKNLGDVDGSLRVKSAVILIRDTVRENSTGGFENRGGAGGTAIEVRLAITPLLVDLEREIEVVTANN